MAIIAKSYGVFLCRWCCFLKRIKAWLSQHCFPLRRHAEQRVPIRQQAQMPRERTGLLWRHRPKRQNVWILFAALPPTSWMIVAELTRSGFFKQCLCPFCICMKHAFVVYGFVQKSKKCKAAKKHYRLHTALVSPREGWWSGEAAGSLPAEIWIQKQARASEQLCRSKSKPTVPNGPFLADSGSRHPGRKAKSGWEELDASTLCFPSLEPFKVRGLPELGVVRMNLATLRGFLNLGAWVVQDKLSGHLGIFSFLGAGGISSALRQTYWITWGFCSC